MGKIQRNTDGSLEIRGMTMDPPHGGPFEIKPEIGRVLANLLASDGVFSRLLKCSTDGELYTYDTNAVDTLSRIESTLGGPLADGGLWYNTESAAYITKSVWSALDDVYFILVDSWDPCNHALRVVTITP